MDGRTELILYSISNDHSDPKSAPQQSVLMSLPNLVPSPRHVLQKNIQTDRKIDKAGITQTNNANNTV